MQLDKHMGSYMTDNLTNITSQIMGEGGGVEVYPPPLKWEMGDILKSNYTGDHFIPYELVIKEYKPFSASVKEKRQIVMLHNLETGEKSEMALSHLNSIGFHNVSRGDTPLPATDALSLGLKQTSIQQHEESNLVISYKHLKEDVLGAHNITIQEVSNIIKDHINDIKNNR